MANKFVAYYRVSTQRQGASGLGLEAQQAAVRAYLNGSSWSLTGEFVEVESGKRSDRVQLAKALEACRVHRATLIIAKLDRLARNVAFVSRLMDSGVEFVAVDFPQANRLTIHILAAVAEHEAGMISARTKAALAAAKARGVQLGNPANLTGEARERGRQAAAATRAGAARAKAADLAPVVRELRDAGVGSLRALAGELNRRGIPAPAGGQWHAQAVRRVLAA